MRDIAILEFVTLDGVMQSPTRPDEDTSGGFAQGGWAAGFMEGVMPQVIAEAMTQPYDLLFGRTTYDLFAEHWPNESDNNPVAKILNRARKYVVTNSPKDGYAWPNTTSVSGDIVSQIARLKNEDGPLLQIHGSCELVHTLMKHGLVDELRLWTFPVVLGQGKRLFGQKTAPADFELIKAGHVENGVAMHWYRRVS